MSSFYRTANGKPVSLEAGPLATLAGRTLRPNVQGVALNPFLVVTLVALFDLLAMLAFFLWSWHQAKFSGPLPGKIWVITDAVFCGSILYLVAVSGSYQVSLFANPYSQVSRILVAASSVTLLEWMALYLSDSSRYFAWPLDGPLDLVSGGVIAMCGARFATYRLLAGAARQGTLLRGVAVVGAGEQGSRLMQALNARKNPWTKIVGIFDDRRDHEGGRCAKVAVDGTVADLIAHARSGRVDDILVALPWGAESRLLDLLNQLKVIPCNIRLAPDGIGHHFLDRGFGRVGGVPVFNVYDKPISGWGALVKRLEDLVLGSVCLAIALPIMAACAIAIRLESPGPVLFRQNRYGYNNKLISVYKFRSMYHHMRDADADRQTTQDDPRITRVGKFIRRTSLDELPQLLNVLKGDMSLVGPRPHATNTKAAGRLFDEVVREYSARHRIKPGITGWAQVMGWRGETDTEEKILRRVECDLYYMENWSLYLDIEILFRTIFALTGKNAY